MAHHSKVRRRVFHVRPILPVRLPHCLALSRQEISVTTTRVHIQSRNTFRPQRDREAIFCRDSRHMSGQTQARTVFRSSRNIQRQDALGRVGVRRVRPPNLFLNDLVGRQEGLDELRLVDRLNPWGSTLFKIRVREAPDMSIACRSRRAEPHQPAPRRPHHWPPGCCSGRQIRRHSDAGASCRNADRRPSSRA